MLPGTAELHREGITSAVERCVIPARHPAVGASRSRDQHVARTVHGDAVAPVIARPAEVGGPEMLPGSAELHHEGVGVAVVRRVIPARHPAGGVGVSRDQHVARTVHGDAGAKVIVRSAEVGGPEMLPVSAEFHHEGVRGAVERRVIPARHPAGGEGISRDQHVARTVHGDAVANVLTRPAEVGGPRQFRVDHQCMSGIVFPQLECIGPFVHQHVPALNLDALTIDLLIDIGGRIGQRLPVAAQVDHQRAVGGDRQALDAVVGDLNLRVIAAGGDEELVLEVAALAEGVQVDACIELFVGHDFIRRHFAAPVGLLAHLVVERRSRLLQPDRPAPGSFDSFGSPGSHKTHRKLPHLHRLRVAAAARRIEGRINFAIRLLRRRGRPEHLKHRAGVGHRHVGPVALVQVTDRIIPLPLVLDEQRGGEVEKLQCRPGFGRGVRHGAEQQAGLEGFKRRGRGEVPGGMPRGGGRLQRKRIPHPADSTASDMMPRPGEEMRNGPGVFVQA